MSVGIHAFGGYVPRLRLQRGVVADANAWVRDEGYLKIVPTAVVRALAAAAVDPGAIAHFCFPSATRRVAATLAKQLGIPAASVRDTLQDICGEVGAAHPLLMLVPCARTGPPGRQGPGDRRLRQSGLRCRREPGRLSVFGDDGHAQLPYRRSTHLLPDPPAYYGMV